LVVAGLLVTLGTASAQTVGLPEDSHIRQQTLQGALERADRRMEFVNRGALLERENVGAVGRKNATNDAAENSEQPRTVRSEFSPWSRW
jgi:hypothetical protein